MRRLTQRKLCVSTPTHAAIKRSVYPRPSRSSSANHTRSDRSPSDDDDRENRCENGRSSLFVEQQPTFELVLDVSQHW
jgi:hypothetical protein